MTATLFYIFSTVTILSSFFVVFSSNPVHSVLFLIFSFFNVAIIFLLSDAEFIAMTLIIVYVGAVAVLFLFVVMMLDINFIKLREGFLQYLPFGALLGVVLFTELIMLFLTEIFSEKKLVSFSDKPIFTEIENTKYLGSVLYTDYFYLFQLSGIILLLAMIGSIVLTLRQRKGVKKQLIFNQVKVSSKKQIIKKKIPLGRGIE